MINNTNKGRSPESVNFTPICRLGYLGPAHKEITKEVWLGKWNGELRIDIRRWCNGNLLAGIDLRADELRYLWAILNKLDFEH